MTHIPLLKERDMKTLVLTACLLVLSSLAAAQETFLPPIPEDQDVTISFYSYNLASAGIGAEGTQQLIDEFEALHPNIQVEAVGVPSPDILARVQAATVAGNPPDVAQLVFDSLGFIVENYNVTPLEQIVPPDELAAHLEGFHPRGVALGQVDGQTYGLAFTFSTPVLFYNADIFREAGLNPDQPPRTWDEVKAYGQQIVESTNHEGIFVGVFGDFDWLLQSLVRSNGGRVLSEDGTSLMFAEPEAVEAVAMLQDLVQSGVHPGLGGVGSDAFNAGNMGMYLNTSAVQASLIAASKGNFELRAAPMPGFGDRPAVPVNSGSALFILASDPLKQRAAWDFMKFVTSERGYTIITSKIGYLPLRPAIVDDPRYLQEWVSENPLVQPNLEQLDRLEPWVSMPGPNYQQIVTVLMGALEESVYGTGDPAAVLSAAQERASQLLP